MRLFNAALVVLAGYGLAYIMSKLGKKLITAAKQAVEVAHCNHGWQKDFYTGKFGSSTYYCPKCRARRTEFVIEKSE